MSRGGRSGAGPPGADPAELDAPGGCRLYRYPPGAGAKGTVVVAHGMFSSARDLRRLSRYLAAAGHDVWAFDFRGHGASSPLPDDEDFESASLRDVRGVLAEVRRHAGTRPVAWVGHSGGGLAALMHLVRREDPHDAIDRLVLVASQATHAGDGPANRARLLGILAALLVFRRVRGARFGVGPGTETRAVLRQWCLWNLRGAWIGHDGLDYLQGLRDVLVPTLALSGAGDGFIAPPGGCEALHDHLGGADTRYVECGPGTGFGTAYGHAGVLCSRPASREVWPLILEWIDGGRTATVPA